MSLPLLNVVSDRTIHVTCQKDGDGKHVRVCVSLHRLVRVLNPVERKHLMDVCADLSTACATRDLLQDLSLKPMKAVRSCKTGVQSMMSPTDFAIKSAWYSAERLRNVEPSMRKRLYRRGPRSTSDTTLPVNERRTHQISLQRAMAK